MQQQGAGGMSWGGTHMPRAPLSMCQAAFHPHQNPTRTQVTREDGGVSANRGGPAGTSAHTTKCLSSQFWRLKGQGQGDGRVAFF